MKLQKERGARASLQQLFFLLFPSSAGERSYRTGRYILAVVQAVIVPDSGNHKVQVLGGLRRLFLPPSPPKKQAGFWIKTNLLE